MPRESTEARERAVDSESTVSVERHNEDRPPACTGGLSSLSRAEHPLPRWMLGRSTLVQEAGLVQDNTRAMTWVKKIEPPPRVVLRFCERVDHSKILGCWPWTLALNAYGYGKIGWSEKGIETYVYAHRLAWWLAHGPIPDHLTIDHRCRNRPCCNPAHLRLLTRADNTRAGFNANRHKTHCPRNHPYDEANTYRNPRGARICRICKRASR
jgi:HNH endonuclease